MDGAVEMKHTTRARFEYLSALLNSEGIPERIRREARYILESLKNDIERNYAEIIPVPPEQALIPRKNKKEPFSDRNLGP